MALFTHLGHLPLQPQMVFPVARPGLSQLNIWERKSMEAPLSKRELEEADRPLGDAQPALLHFASLSIWVAVARPMGYTGCSSKAAEAHRGIAEDVPPGPAATLMCGFVAPHAGLLTFVLVDFRLVP